VKKARIMKMHRLLAATATAVLALTGSAVLAQGQDKQKGHAEFDANDQQVTREWYAQNSERPAVGLRDEDRLSAREESRLHVGALMDKDLRNKVHPAPLDLTRRLPDPLSDHSYVLIGGHLALVDSAFRIKAVIHLNDNH
jgi:hypothetical protein